MTVAAILNWRARSDDETNLLQAVKEGRLDVVQDVLAREGVEFNFLRPVGSESEPLVQKMMTHALSHDFAMVGQPMIAAVVATVPESQRSHVFDLMLRDVLQNSTLKIDQKKAVLALFPLGFVGNALRAQRVKLINDMGSCREGIADFESKNSQEHIADLRGYAKYRPVGIDLTRVGEALGMYEHNCDKLAELREKMVEVQNLANDVLPHPVVASAAVLAFKNTASVSSMSAAGMPIAAVEPSL